MQTVKTLIRRRDLGLHFLPMSLLWDARYKWVNIVSILYSSTAFTRDNFSKSILHLLSGYYKPVLFDLQLESNRYYRWRDLTLDRINYINNYQFYNEWNLYNINPVNISIFFFRNKHTESSALVAQLDAPSDWRPGGRGFNPRRGWQHSFVEIDREIFSTVILSLPLIQEGQLSVSGERMCTILVNRLED